MSFQYFETLASASLRDESTSGLNLAIAITFLIYFIYCIKKLVPIKGTRYCSRYHPNLHK
jgi:hypothetical protein